MAETLVHSCQCPNCQKPEDHPDKILHHQMNLLLSRLDEQQRRWYLALEANRLGPSSEKLLALISGLSEKTIVRGQLELQQDLTTRPTERLRLSGAGRKPAVVCFHKTRPPKRRRNEVK